MVALIYSILPQCFRIFPAIDINAADQIGLLFVTVKHNIALLWEIMSYDAENYLYEIK